MVWQKYKQLRHSQKSVLFLFIFLSASSSYVRDCTAACFLSLRGESLRHRQIMEALSLVIWATGNVFSHVWMTNTSSGHWIQVPAADGEVPGWSEPHAEAPVGLFEVGRHGRETICRRRHDAYRYTLERVLSFWKKKKKEGNKLVENCKSLVITSHVCNKYLISPTCSYFHLKTSEDIQLAVTVSILERISSNFLFVCFFWGGGSHPHHHTNQSPIPTHCNRDLGYRNHHHRDHKAA